MKAADQLNPDPSDTTCTFDWDLRIRLIQEEAQELVEATTEGDKIDALFDLLYVTYGTLVAWNIPFSLIWDAIHEANMEKVEFGVKDEHGKITKPAWWTHPPIQDIWDLMYGKWVPNESEKVLLTYLLREGRDYCSSIMCYPPAAPYRMDTEEEVDTQMLRKLTFMRLLDRQPAQLSGPMVWTASDTLRACLESQPDLLN